MLGRKDYTQEELDTARTAIEGQLAAYRKLAKAAGDDKARAAFDRRFFLTMTMALDRHFVHRLRGSTGKDTNALNEVELIVDGLLNHGGVFRTNKVIKWVPEDSVTGFADGDEIALDAQTYERLAKAFLGEVEKRFLPG